MGITWAVAWWFLAFESPSKHPHITEHERIYIETSIGENTSILSAVSIMEVIEATNLYMGLDRRKAVFRVCDQHRRSKLCLALHMSYKD